MTWYLGFWYTFARTLSPWAKVKLYIQGYHSSKGTILEKCIKMLKCIRAHSISFIEACNSIFLFLFLFLFSTGFDAKVLFFIALWWLLSICFDYFLRSRRLGSSTLKQFKRIWRVERIWVLIIECAMLLSILCLLAINLCLYFQWSLRMGDPEKHGEGLTL